ncbi:MAG: signal peptide peptidase SppA [Alphaproteobacteria bacterium]|nr:signal peptide peptidase SppA [Alphaproteobacteria bacterium]
MKRIGSLFYKPSSKNAGEDVPKRWSLFRIIGKALKRTCTALGAMMLLSIAISFFMLYSLGARGPEPLPDEMVLVLKIEDGITEIQTQPSFLDPFPFMQPTVRNVTKALNRAAQDDRVRGLVVHYKGGGMNVAHIQELRPAIKRFRESGKFSKIYASSFADERGGLDQYYFASAFEEIWMQPVGMLSVSGMSVEMPFAKAFLDKIGVRGEFFQREEYKTAMENFTREEISPENKKMLGDMLGNINARMMSGITKDRDINMAELGMLVDKGLLSGEEALEKGLIDRLDYSDILLADIREKVSGDPEDESVELVSLPRYLHGKPQDGSEKFSVGLDVSSDVALIYIVGNIVEMAGTGGNAGADDISAAINDAIQDEAIEAIIVRVDSPGGSPTASETIRRSLVRAQQKGKKVIVSMGPVAASGGYWVAANADYIFALPSTITGSIGVVMGKFELSQLWEKLGVNWDGVQYGANSDLWSANQPFDAAAKERMNALIDVTYDAFLSRVAVGRKIPLEELRTIAKGRAWSGEQAKLNGLVDSLGGLDDALDYTAELLELESRENLKIIRLPRQRGRLEEIIEMLGEQQVKLSFLNKIILWFERVHSSQEDFFESSVYRSDLEYLRQ